MQEQECFKTAASFLEEKSEELSEYGTLIKRGVRGFTTIDGRSLVNILNEYLVIKNEGKSKRIMHFL